MGIIQAAYREGKRDDAQTKVLLRKVMGSRFINALVHDHNADVGTMLEQAGMAVRSGHSRGGLYTELRLVDWKSLQLASTSMAMHPSALWAPRGHSEPQNMDANNNTAQSSDSENNDDSAVMLLVPQVIHAMVLSNMMRSVLCVYYWFVL